MTSPDASAQKQLFDVVGGNVVVLRPRGRPSTGKAHRADPSRPCHEPGCLHFAMYRRRYCEDHVPRCNEPGCIQPRRGRSGARYCDEHARSRDYVIDATVELECIGCDEMFRRRRTRDVTYPSSIAWREFCPECVGKSPLSLATLRRHNVPYEFTKRWLVLGDELSCEFPNCGRRLTHRGVARPYIDHDHGHCPREHSCGECVRGVLCAVCNTAVAHFERLLRRATLDDVEAYLGWEDRVFR